MSPSTAAHSIFCMYSQIEVREAEQNEEQAVRCCRSLLPLCVLCLIVIVCICLFVGLYIVSLSLQILKLLFQFPIGTCFSVS